MKKPFADHSLDKILEDESEPELVKSIVDDKIIHLNEVAEVIRTNHGSKAVENLEYKFLLRAFEQCRDRVTPPSTNVTSEDIYIYHFYLTNQLREAEKFIDDKFSHLGL